MDSTPRTGRQRRQVLAAAVVALLLAACGGGSGPANPGDGSGPVGGAPGEQPSHQPAPVPQIARFEASTTQAFVGDAVTLRGEFSGGSGRIDPTLGAVVSGTEVSSGPLDRDTSFQLVVSAPGAQDVERALTVRVDFRDDYVNLPVPFAGARHAAVLAADGTVLLIGGSRSDGGPSNRIDRFDLNTNNVRPAGQLLAARVGPVATRLTAGQVLVTGGSIEPQQASTAELVNERTGQSSFAGRMSVARTDHAAVALGGGRVLVTGGVTSGEGVPNAITASAEIWEPATRSFRRLSAPMHTPRSSHTMTTLGDGRILIVGGYSAGVDARLGEIFDPVTETFTPVPSVLPLRANHAALNTPDGQVLVLGGDAPQAGADEPVAIASVLRYDPADNQFREMPPLAAPRTDVRAAMLPSGQVLLFGGLQWGQSATSAERYDPAQGSTPIRPLDSARHGHSVTRLNNGRIVIIGGEGSGGGFAAGLRVYR